jgi:uncharacterized membrane protein
MNTNRYRQVRLLAILFIGAVVAVAVFQNSYLLAMVGILTGFLVLVLVRSKAIITADERELTVREKAAHTTYAIFAPTIGIGAFLLLIPYKDISPVFANGDFVYLKSLGVIFAYLSLFLISLYAISYHYFNKKYGGGEDKE